MNQRPRVLVTGASGFIGRALVESLIASGVDVSSAVRRPLDHVSPRVREVVIGEIGPDTDWTDALREVTHVVHLAARVHQMRDTAADPLAAFRRVNTAGTRVLAEQALHAGARRFVLVSSIKVNGEETMPGRPFTPEDSANPCDPYGVSKAEAESALRAVAATGRMEVVIVRPPLVYGPGVRANFRNMVGWVARGVPLPFGAIASNRRSLVALPNLISLLQATLVHPDAVGHTFLVSDGEDLSTTELLRRTARALGVAPRLLPVPVSALRAVARLVGRPGVAQRLCASLQVDSSSAQRILGWHPPISVDEALVQTVSAVRGS